jgi:hypothetical protein
MCIIYNPYFHYSVFSNTVAKGKIINITKQNRYNDFYHIFCCNHDIYIWANYSVSSYLYFIPICWNVLIWLKYDFMHIYLCIIFPCTLTYNLWDHCADTGSWIREQSWIGIPIQISTSLCRFYKQFLTSLYRSALFGIFFKPDSKQKYLQVEQSWNNSLKDLFFAICPFKDLVSHNQIKKANRGLY